MTEAEIATLENLALNYAPKEILQELSQVYFRRLTTLKEGLDEGVTVTTATVRAQSAWQEIGNFATTTFKDDAVIES
jgi:hypothetical protein